MIVRLDVRDEKTARDVLAVQIPAYRVEADLIGFDGIPPLHDTTETLQCCEETFFGWLEDGALAGAISYEREAEDAVICRMMVHPAHFRKGIAKQLLQHLLAHLAAEEPRPARVHVSTGAVNEPAKRLYEQHGFTETGQREVGPGVWISQFIAAPTT